MVKYNFMENNQAIVPVSLLYKYAKILPTLIKTLEKEGSWNNTKTELLISKDKMLEILRDNNQAPPEAHEQPNISMMRSLYDLSVFRWTILGLNVVEKNNWLERINICKSCVFWDSPKNFPDLGYCVLGGQNGIKSWLSESECPSHKWPTANTQESQS
jgi:hypothetical protein